MNNDRRKNKIARLFFIMLRIGSIGFGGGNALIPVIREQVIEKNALVTETEYEEDVMIASITPGALPVEIAGGIGHRIGGWKGTLLSSYGMALPGVVFTLILISCFRYINEGAAIQIKNATVGVSAFIAVLLVDYIIGTFSGKKDVSAKSNIGKIAIVLIVAVLTGLKNIVKILGYSDVPIISLATIDVFVLAFFVIFCCAVKFRVWKLTASSVICIAYVVARSGLLPIDNATALIVIRCLMAIWSLVAIVGTCIKERGKYAVNDKSRFVDLGALAAIVVIFLFVAVIFSTSAPVFAGKGALSSIISFGGGDAYLTVADGLFVVNGNVSENDFYGTVVPIVNVLPGSILCKTLSSVGFIWGSSETGTLIGGIVFALVGFTVSVFASCGIFSLVHAGYGAVSELVFFKVIREWIRPIVAGLMISVILSLIYQIRMIDTSIYGWLYVAVMMVLFVVGMILRRKKVSNALIILIGIIVSVIACNFLAFF